MAMAASFKAQGRAAYTWYHGQLSIRPAQPRIGFKLPYDVVLPGNFERILAEVKSAKLVAVDTETTSLDPDVAKLCCVSFCCGATAYSVFVEHSETKALLPREQFLVLMDAIRHAPSLGFFNCNYDFRILRNCIPELDWSVIDNKIIDAQGLVFLSDTNNWQWSLKKAAKFFLGVDPPEFDQDSVGENIFLQPIKDLLFYACFDAWNTWQLIYLFYPEMKKYYGFVLTLDNKLHLPLIEFEENQLPVNWDTMKAYAEQTLRKMELTREEFFAKYGVMNMNSGPQKIQLLQRLGFDTGEKTDTGLMKVGIKQLEKIKDRCDAAGLLINYSKLNKAMSAYISPMLEREAAGLPIRFKYRQYRVPTYRMAAGSYAVSKKKKLKNAGYWAAMNLQAAMKPKQAERFADFDPVNFNWSFHDKGEYLVETGAEGLSWRKAFEVDEDEVWISTDFGGQELVVAGDLSGERVFLDAFLKGEDLHKKMAIAIWGIENYDKNKRKMAKIANFLIIYGGSAFTLSQSLGIDLAQAEFIVNQMKESIPTLFKWVEETQRKARQQGFLVNAYGLPRQLAPYYRMGESWASFADRTAVNTLVQSCGSVIIRIVLRKLWELIKNKYPTTVQFLATIHDEVNFRVKKSVLLAFLEDLERIMVGANHPEWEVKAGVEHSIGRNWAEVVAVSLVRDSEGHVVAVVPKGEKADHSKHVVLEKPAEIEDIIIEEWEEEE